MKWIMHVKVLYKLEVLCDYYFDDFYIIVCKDNSYKNRLKPERVK